MTYSHKHTHAHTHLDVSKGNPIKPRAINPPEENTKTINQSIDHLSSSIDRETPCHHPGHSLHQIACQSSMQPPSPSHIHFIQQSIQCIFICDVRCQTSKNEKQHKREENHHHHHHQSPIYYLTHRTHAHIHICFWKIPGEIFSGTWRGVAVRARIHLFLLYCKYSYKYKLN